jgi:acetolactate synthase I/II/III large subunit
LQTFAAFAKANRLPTAVAFRFQDLFDNRNELYIGDVGLGINPRLAQCVRDVGTSVPSASRTRSTGACARVELAMHARGLVAALAVGAGVVGGGKRADDELPGLTD